MEQQKVFIANENTANIYCHSCCKEWPCSVEKLVGQHKFRARCTCGSVFRVELDFREKYRKKTDLDAFVEPVSGKEKWRKITSDSTTTNPQSANSRIRNISVIGIGLTFFGDNNLREGDQIIIKFSLYGPESSRLKKRAVVKSARGNYIGCEFLQEDKYDKKLAFYAL